MLNKFVTKENIVLFLLVVVATPLFIGSTFFVYRFLTPSPAIQANSDNKKACTFISQHINYPDHVELVQCKETIENHSYGYKTKGYYHPASRTVVLSINDGALKTALHEKKHVRQDQTLNYYLGPASTVYGHLRYMLYQIWYGPYENPEEAEAREFARQKYPDLIEKLTQKYRSCLVKKPTGSTCDTLHRLTSGSSFYLPKRYTKDDLPMEGENIVERRHKNYTAFYSLNDAHSITWMLEDKGVPYIYNGTKWNSDDFNILNVFIESEKKLPTKILKLKGSMLPDKYNIDTKKTFNKNRYQHNIKFTSYNSQSLPTDYLIDNLLSN